MAIEFHCEHCNHLIKAPDDAGGRTGKCPHCQNAAYIPRQDEGELDLAPLDDDEEMRRKKAAQEAAAYQKSLLHERNVPGEKGGRAAGGKPGATGQFISDTRHVTSQIVRYVEAMSTGKLDTAEAVAQDLAPHKATVVQVLTDMAKGDLGAYGLPALPKPVLMGFLKQLHQRL